MVCWLLRLPVTEVEVIALIQVKSILPAKQSFLLLKFTMGVEGGGEGAGAGSNHQECKLSRHKAPKLRGLSNASVSRGACK